MTASVYVIIDAPSPLGLWESGVERLPEALKAYDLLAGCRRDRARGWRRSNILRIGIPKPAFERSLDRRLFITTRCNLGRRMGQGSDPDHSWRRLLDTDWRNARFEEQGPLRSLLHGWAYRLLRSA